MKKLFSGKMMSVLAVTAMLVSSLGAVEVLCAEESASDAVVSSSAVNVSERTEGKHSRKDGSQKPAKAKGERRARCKKDDEAKADSAKKEKPAKKSRKPEKKGEKDKKAAAEASTETTTTAE